MTRRPTTSMSATKAATLTRVRPTTPQMPEPTAHAAKRAGACVGACVGAAENARQRRQQHQRQHHGEVFDDQPADGDAAPLGLDQPALLQGAQQHDRDGDRQRQPEHQPRAERPAEQPGEPAPSSRRERHLDDGAGHGDRPHRQQILQRKMQADAEHQQDDADLGQFRRQALVGDEARRVRPDQHAGEEIADQRRDAEAVGQAPRMKARPRPATMVAISGVSCGMQGSVPSKVANPATFEGTLMSALPVIWRK